VKTVEIACRCGDDAAAAQARPADADASRRRMDDGNGAFAGLFAQVDAPSGMTRRVIPISGQDFGLGGASCGWRATHSATTCGEA
jgi:hypothetical protein